MTEVFPVRVNEGNLSKTLREVREVFAQLGPSNREIADVARDLEERIKKKTIDSRIYNQLNSYSSNSRIALLGELCNYNSSLKRYRDLLS